jgi:hypothetical protein
MAIRTVSNMLTQLRQGIDRVFNLEDSGGVLHHIRISHSKRLLMEYGSVLSPNVKDGIIVWPVVGLIVNVSRWPLVEIKLEAEEVTLQKASHLNTFFDQVLEIIEEQETRNKIVLVLVDVLNDDLDGTDLVILQS